MESDVFNADDEKRRLSYVRDLCKISLTGLETIFLCKHALELLIKLAFNEWMIKDKEKNENPFFFKHKEVEESFGLEEYSSSSKFFPASGLKGPFQHLLKFHPKRGLDFIIDLLNLTAEKYAYSDLGTPERYSALPIDTSSIGVEKLTIYLKDGETIDQYCSNRL